MRTMPSANGRGSGFARDPKQEFARLGLTARRIGYWDLSHAILLVKEDESVVQSMIKQVYEPVGAGRSVTWRCVETAMRSAVRDIWRAGDRTLLEKIMGHALPEPPRVSDFLDAFVSYLKRDDNGKRS